MDKYYVTRIEEPDFGCEGRPEGQEIKDKVYLKEEITKEETIIFMEDKLLYERDINEGMKEMCIRDRGYADRTGVYHEAGYRRSENGRRGNLFGQGSTCSGKKV